MRGLREIVSEDEKAALPAVLEAWGYPRALAEHETALGVWFAYGPDGLFWFVRDASWQASDEAEVHVCAAPDARGHIASRWALAAIETVASLLGVRVLYAADREAWRGLLLRLGWREYAYAGGRLRRDLGQRPPVWTREAAELEKRLLAEDAQTRKACAREEVRDG
jgi:hypothetical protein